MQGESDLTEFWQTLRRQWKSALAVATVVFAGSAALTLTQIPEYESETLILMDNQQTSPFGSDLEQPITIGKSQDLSTEIEILRSQSLVADAVSKLNGQFGELTLKDIVSNLNIHQAGTADVLIVSFTDTDPERAKAFLEALGTTYVDYSLERKRSQATNGIAFINEQLPEAREELNRAAAALREFQERYGVLEPSAYGEQIATYQQTLNQQLDETEAALSANQRRRQELRRQMAEAGQASETTLARAVLSEDEAYQTLVAQYKDLESQYALARTRFQDTYPLVQDLKEQYEEARRLLRERTAQVLGSAAGAVNVNQVPGTGETQRLLASQLLQVNVEVAAQQNQLGELQQAKAQVTNIFQRIPQLQQVYTELQRQTEITSQSVNYLLEKQQELQIAEAQEIAPWEVIEPPFLPEDPVSPNVPRNLALGFVAGALLGVGAAVLLQQQDQRIKHVEELKQVTRLPLLGTIPRVNQPFVSVKVDADEPRYSYNYSFFTEAVRSLAMNLRYLVIETGRIKTLALTSATPAEGKSTVTYSLGVVLAELGLRVLVVDADMRKPVIHSRARIANNEGLSTIIATDRPWQEFTQAGEVKNLEIITSGPNSPNPVALLNSEKMKQLLDEWRQAYDYVLIDTPPVGVIADAQGLVNHVDSAIFVAGIDRATRGSVERAMEILRGSQCSLAGFVANFVERGHDYHSYTYYGYHDARGNGKGNGQREIEGKMQDLLRQVRRR